MALGLINKKLVTDQITELFKRLEDFDKVVSNASNGTGVYPEVQDVLVDLDITELEKLVEQSQKLSANFVNGACIDLIHMASATLREASLCQKSKSAFYVESSSEANADIQYNNDTKSYRLGMVENI
jgi:hypothetical protein